MKTLLPFKEFHCPESPYTALTPIQSKVISDFNQKVKSGAIEFETVPCICGSTAFDLIASVDRYSMLQKTVMCRQCGLIQSNPRMTEKACADFYSSDLYRLCYEGENYLDISGSRYDIDSVRHIFDEVNKIKEINSNCSILEFGAGGGWNLLPFVNAGAKTAGIDYSRSLVELGLKRGLNIKQGTVANIDGLFDVIIMNHVAEHFSGFLSSIRKVSDHLKSKGVIYIAVPNILVFGMGQLQNAHTYYFTPGTFKHYCAKAGLKLLKMGNAQRIHIFGIFELSQASPYGLDTHYKKMLRRFREIRLRRSIKNILKDNIAESYYARY